MGERNPLRLVKHVTEGDVRLVVQVLIQALELHVYLQPACSRHTPTSVNVVNEILHSKGHACLPLDNLVAHGLL